MGVEINMDMIFRAFELIISGVFVLLWWLMREKDKTTQENIKSIREEWKNSIKFVLDEHKGDIKKLWEEHDRDVRRLQDVELEIAKHHYIKGELDEKFDELRKEIKDGLHSLGEQLRFFTEALLKNSHKD